MWSMIQNEAAHQLETAQENVYNVMLNEKKKETNIQYVFNYK